MHNLILLTIASGAAAASIQEVVDGLFEKYLPQKASLDEVTSCRTKCNEDEACLAACPKHECPFHRISAQCNLFNNSLAAAKACHHTCGHDHACHFKCPHTMPTSMRELQGFGKAMVCHSQCGHDHACHKACHKDANPWQEKRARCEKLDAVVACLQNGGSHSTCPRLDAETRTQLMQEPWSLPKDIANHVMDYLMPLPEGQEVPIEEVKACHMRCGHDGACHKNCPKGVFGRFADECDKINETSACHSACEQAEIKCSVKKAECHFKCPMSMPTSVKEAKGLADHMLCHATCGQNRTCHDSCPHSHWDEKKSQCMKYQEMVSCHKGCGGEHSCHATCPRLDNRIMYKMKQAPSNLAKDLIDTLLV